ncbi:transmembrane protein 205-like, partial [Ctenocephalides felis]
ILTRTTQPVHVVAVVAVLLISSLVYPSLVHSNHRLQPEPMVHEQSTFANLLYLAAFCTHFGTQVWMTFVSGLALYFSLPRHTFGLCQEVLFPKYFALNAALSAATLILYARRGATTDSVQLFALAFCTALELGVRLYLAPPILRLMRAKNAVEAAAGIGNEVGQLNAGELIKKCPHYASLHRAFRSVHVAAAAANVMAMACTFVHLHHLAGRMSGL